MWENIAGDYFRAYSWRGVKEMWKTVAVGFFGMINSLIVFFFQMSSDEKIACLLVYLPMLYILVSVYMHPVGLSKMMYLCPMEADGRRQYICGSYRFRILVHMSVAVIGLGILMIFYDCDMIAVAEILVNDLVLSLLIPSGEKTDEKYGSIQKETVCMICMIVVSILSNFMLSLAVTDKEAGKVIDSIIFFICIVFIQMPLSIAYQKYVRSELEAAVYYESL